MAEVSSHYQARGSSIPVENVQALAAASHGSEEVPPRYIRPEATADPVVRGGGVVIPVIDLGRLHDPLFSDEELTNLEFACREWGFFQDIRTRKTIDCGTRRGKLYYLNLIPESSHQLAHNLSMDTVIHLRILRSGSGLINHGVPKELMEQMKDDISEFFKLPLEEKKAYSQLPNNLEGYGQAFVVSEDQKLDWADMFYLSTRPISTRNFRFWPTHPSSFRVTLDRFSFELKNLASFLLGSMAKNLGIDPEILLKIFKDQPQGLRFNYYPPCLKADKVLGISPHTDASGLTLLLQVNEVQGLQIKKSGKWFPVEPLHGAFVVNIGDILEILSNGKYKSIEHRVIINPKMERLSIAAFHGPDQHSMVGPLPELLRGGKESYKTMSYEDYMKIFFSKKLDGRSLLERMKVE